jgi:hypothetical protein
MIIIIIIPLPPLYAERPPNGSKGSSLRTSSRWRSRVVACSSCRRCSASLWSSAASSAARSASSAAACAACAAACRSYSHCSERCQTWPLPVSLIPKAT